jgi:putative transposase
LDCSVNNKQHLIEVDHEQLSVRRQCHLLGVARSSFYYQGQPDSEADLCLMRLLDEQYTRTPFYGIRRMTAWLQQQGHIVNHKRVQRLLRRMGMEAIYPKPNLSQPTAGHQIYPDLLRGVRMERVNQVWSSDITYVRLLNGFVYLVAVIDWFSRYVLSWEISVTLDADFCVSALERALEVGKPEIFNTDQGSQFTSQAFTQRLQEREIRISMDGRGRALDNIFVERLWRTVKYEDIYLKEYASVPEVNGGLGQYFQFYNGERLHQSLNYKTPAAVYGLA